LKTIGPIERALALVERQQREMDLLKAELLALVAEEDRPRRSYFLDPLTGEKRYIRRRGTARHSEK
jgi:hypothetical protein